MYNGDFSGIAADVMIMKRFIYNSIRPMSFAMDIQSGISEERQTQIDEQIDQSILGSSINFLLYEWMTNLDFPQLPNEFRAFEANKVNALLLSGSLDGRTYLNSGIEITKKFENGRHLIIENSGHEQHQ